MKSQKTIVFTALTIVAVALAVVSIFAFAYAGTSAAATYPNATTPGTNGYYHNGMMGGMMGGNWGPSSPVQTQVATQNTVFPLVGFAALIGAAIIGTGGAIYYFTGPKIRIAEPVPKTIVDQTPQNTVTPYDSVSKTLTTEERKVLDVLISHNGKYLQKYIRAETGLSRLKTHRIVSRLAERGIVTLERSGNTNEVHLSSWLQNKPYPNPINDKQAENQELMVEA
jgi:uncharacterized membrane protein